MIKPKKQKREKPFVVPELAVTDKIGHDLEWHFAAVESDAGLRSSQGPLVDMALSGPPTGGARRANDAHVTDHWHGKNNKHRRIHAALCAMTPELRRVLAHAYTPDRWPRETYLKFPLLGRCVGVVLLSRAAHEGFVEAVAERALRGAEVAKRFADKGIGEWLRGKVDKATLARIAIESDELLSVARAEFVKHYNAVKKTAEKIRETALKQPLPKRDPIALPRRVFAE